MDTKQTIAEVLKALEDKILAAEVVWDHPCSQGSTLNTMSGHLVGSEKFPFVLSVVMKGPDKGAYSVAVFTDIGVIKTGQQAPEGKLYGKVQAAIVNALDYVRGVVIARKGTAIEFALEIT